MEVVESSLSGVPHLKVVGDVDHAAAPVLEQSIHRALGEDGGRIFLDLAECPYFDSGGLSVLLFTVREVRGTGWLGVIAPGANLLRLFEIVGLNSAVDFHVFSSSEEAAAAAEN